MSSSVGLMQPVDEGEETLSRHGDPIFADHRGHGQLGVENSAHPGAIPLSEKGFLLSVYFRTKMPATLLPVILGN
jgi:hypothetical protein